MSLVETKNRYHLALDGVGLILQGAPDRLSSAYQMNQAPIYGNRFASGDRDYTDFSFWWYWAQTDFSAGIKHEPIWEDDGKYFSGEGVDTSEQPGSVVLTHQPSSTGSTAKDVTYFDHGDAGGIGVMVGRNNTDQKMRITKITASLGTSMWEDSATGANEKINACASLGGNQRLYLGCNTVGSGASTFKYSDGGSASDLGTLTDAVYSVVPYLAGDALYLFTAGGIVKHDRAAGTNTNVMSSYPQGLSYTSFSFGNLNGKGAYAVGDRLVFLMKTSDGYAHLMAYDISEDAYVHIYTFGRGFEPTKLIERDGNVYIIGQSIQTAHLEVWKYVASSGALARIHELGRVGQTTNIIGSPVKDISNIHFIVDDGTSDYEVWQIDNSDNLHASWSGSSNVASTATYLACVLGGYLVIGKDGASGTNRFEINTLIGVNASRMESGNIVTSIFDGGIPAIDKLFNSIVINFSLFTNANQSITVEYSKDEGSNWTSLGSASYSVDGGAVTSKKLYFGTAVVSKTLMLRFTLAGSGALATPFKAFSVQYVPLIDYTKSWTLRINAATDLKDMTGGLVDITGRELRGRLEAAWMTKSLVDFQDLDYAATQVNANPLSASVTTVPVDDTSAFPERGRLRIENEEIIYTGKTPHSFTGCTRGARGTLAVAHADNTVVSNAYRVIITDMSQAVPIALDGKWLEYVVALSIREA